MHCGGPQSIMRRRNAFHTSHNALQDARNALWSTAKHYAARRSPSNAFQIAHNALPSERQVCKALQRARKALQDAGNALWRPAKHYAAPQRVSGLP